MKAFLVLAAGLALSISSASAECPGHSKVQASVDTQTTASVDKSDTATTTEIKKEVPPKTG